MIENIFIGLKDKKDDRAINDRAKYYVIDLSSTVKDTLWESYGLERDIIKQLSWKGYGTNDGPSKYHEMGVFKYPKKNPPSCTTKIRFYPRQGVFVPEDDEIYLPINGRNKDKNLKSFDSAVVILKGGTQLDTDVGIAVINWFKELIYYFNQRKEEYPKTYGPGPVSYDIIKFLGKDQK